MAAMFYKENLMLFHCGIIVNDNYSLVFSGKWQQRYTRNMWISFQTSEAGENCGCPQVMLKWDHQQLIRMVATKEEHWNKSYPNSMPVLLTIYSAFSGFSYLLDNRGTITDIKASLNCISHKPKYITIGKLASDKSCFQLFCENSWFSMLTGCCAS